MELTTCMCETLRAMKTWAGPHKHHGNHEKKGHKPDLSSPRKLEFLRTSSCWCSCPDVRLSSLASLSRALNSLLASELLSWTIVRSPSRWFRASVVSLICALQNRNINRFLDEISAALTSFHLLKVIMCFRDPNVNAGF